MDNNQILNAASEVLDALVVEHGTLQKYTQEHRELASKIDFSVNFVTQTLHGSGGDTLYHLLEGRRIEEQLTRARIDTLRSSLFGSLSALKHDSSTMAAIEVWWRIEEQRQIQELAGVPAKFRTAHVNAGKPWIPVHGTLATHNLLCGRGTHLRIGIYTGRTEDSGRSFCVHQAHKNPNSNWTNKKLRLEKWLPEEMGIIGLMDRRELTAQSRL